MFKKYLIFTLIIFIFPLQLLAVELEYDANGNLIYDGAWTYTYDYRDQLTQMANGVSTTTYAYDHTGTRISKTVNGVTTIMPNKYYSVTGATTTKSIFNPQTGELIATVVGDGTSTSTNYIHADHLGGTAVVTDEEGNLKETLDYYPYGETRIDELTGNEATERKFTGHELDSETGLYYMGARYYNPEIGRFITQDPAYRAIGNPEELQKITGMSQQEFLANPQRLNAYSYALNNPINNVDRTGESTVSAWLFHPIRTLTHTAAWLGITKGYLKTKDNWNVSSAFLERSLTINPKPLNISEGNDKYGVIDKIRNSNKYQDTVKKAISDANKSGLTSLDTGNHLIRFEDGDLFGALHDATIRVTGNRNQNGTWDLNTSLYDKYDFKYGVKNYNDNFEAQAGGNAAAYSQNRDVISNYDINIKFKDNK